MDASTARDMIEDLMLEIAQLQKERRLQARAISRHYDEIARLREQIRQLEAERDQWQRQAMSHG